jgi:quercetin dioxygenase-like cupin family protein
MYARVGGFFAYGGKGAEQSATIYFAVPPGDRLGKHVDTAEETQAILSGEGEHWDTDTWPPDDTKVTGSPNRG